MINIASLKQVATRSAGRGLLVARKFSPEILTAVGVVGVVTSAVLASRATLKLEPIVGDFREGRDVAGVRKSHVSEQEHAKDLAYVYTRATMDIVKLYGPAITMGVGSIACIIGAQGIMKKRNIALIGAYKAVESSFGAYRDRVVEEFGEEKDQEYARGIRKETQIDEKTGKKTEVTVFDPTSTSTYARFFDENAPAFSPTAEYNLLFLKCQQNYANDLLFSRGHIFLNEVYDMIGIPRSQAGAVVGWVLNGPGDHYVDFGIYNFGSEKAREFVNGQESAILLDFNVDGVVFDKI